MRTFSMATAVALLSACAPVPGPQRAATPTAAPNPIDTTAIRGYTRFLADDALAGRMTGTREANLSALYITSSCIGIGLRPVGNAYLQPVKLQQSRILPEETELRLVRSAAGSKLYHFQQDFI